MKRFLVLLVAALSCSSSALSQAPHPAQPCIYGEMWSEVYGSNVNPPSARAVAGDFIHIPAGKTILIDEDTPALGGLFVEGTLAFDDCVGGFELKSAYILVTGTLQVGYKQPNGTIHEFTKDATITLAAPESYPHSTFPPDDWGVNWTGTEADFEFPGGVGNPIFLAARDRGLIVTRSGQLLIYGMDRQVSWTSLDATAGIGANQIDLLDSPIAGWRAGDEIVIASTDFEYPDPNHNLGNRPVGYAQGEVVTVASAPSSSLVDISPALTFQHFGKDIQGPTGSGMRSIPERAEVGLLTRNVVIQGTASALSSFWRNGNQHLGHVILIDDNASDSLVPYCEVEWAEFRNLGIQATLARYPFHWHMLGDAYAAGPMPYLKNSSVHDCVNRFVSIHNTKNILLEGNVGYKTQGMGFFLEDDTPQMDAVEGVQVRRNLGLAVDGFPNGIANNGIPVDLFNKDRGQPSVFWIMSPKNQVEDNHAAGAFGHGFYLISPKAVMFTHDSSETTYFRNNTAHSNGQHGFYHDHRPRWQYDPANGDLPTASGLVSYKNRRYGIWWRGKGRLHLEDLKLADNKSGFYPASEGTQNPGEVLVPASPYALTAHMSIDNCTIFGETDNTGHQPFWNHAEQAAGRSLPQTYLHFTRPGSQVQFHAPWDTVNGIEAYDGLLEMTNFEIAYFEDLWLPDPATGAGSELRPTGGITQTEYESFYSEDPRNWVANWNVDTNSVDHPAYFRTPKQGASMVWNTIIHDPGNALGYGSNMVLSYLDPYFIANSSNSTTSVAWPSDQLYATPDADIAYAQVTVSDEHTSHSSLHDLTVRVIDQAGVPQELTELIHTGGGTTNPKLWTFNIAVGLQDGDPATEKTGIYYLEFPQGTPSGHFPTKYDIVVKFAEDIGMETVLCVPFVGSVTNVKVNGIPITPPSTDYNNDTFIDERDLLHPTAPTDLYFLDTAANRIWIKTTTVVLATNGSPSIEGTDNTITIR